MRLQYPADGMVRDLPLHDILALLTSDWQYLITYPIAQGNLLNLVVVARDMSLEGTLHPQPWVSRSSLDELRHYLETAAPEPRAIMAVNTAI